MLASSRHCRLRTWVNVLAATSTSATTGESDNARRLAQITIVTTNPAAGRATANRSSGWPFSSQFTTSKAAVANDVNSTMTASAASQVRAWKGDLPTPVSWPVASRQVVTVAQIVASKSGVLSGLTVEERVLPNSLRRLPFSVVSTSIARANTSLAALESSRSARRLSTLAFYC